MTPRKPGSLALGAALLQRLLPVRAPFAMVDRVESYAREPVPALTAVRHVTVNEPVFAAHFAFLPVLPGTMVLEGLAQSAGILGGILHLQRAFEARGRDGNEALELLRNLDRGFRLDPAYRPGVGDELLAALDPARPPYVGMLAASDVRFRRSVFPGECVTYSVRLARELEGLAHFEVEATAAGQRVADGTLVNATMAARLPGARLETP